ncbi:hypothetical protein JCM1841_005174 [Sporobolomyces salmonicolor]
MLSAVRSARASARPLARQLHQTCVARVVTEFQMPAMSPTMTEGTIAEWKVEEGASFVAGDVLLSIETDKATIDVEAQDDGIMGKIGTPNGSAGIPVGKVIALLAEEGDDISNLSIPTESSSASAASSSSSAPPPSESKSESAPSGAPTPSPMTPSPVPSATHAHPTHSKPLLPSVLRQLALAGVSDTSEIKGTGFKGMLTKGDVLAFLGKIKSPYGSIKPESAHGHGHPALEQAASPKDTKKQVEVLLDGPAIRQLIATGLGSAAAPKATPAAKSSISFDSILDDYLPAARRSTPASPSSSPIPPPRASKNAFDDILGL